MVNVGIYIMDFGWNESESRMDPNGTKMKHKWNVNGTPMEFWWGCMWKQIFFNKVVVNK
jgi:hypothetical protein